MENTFSKIVSRSDNNCFGDELFILGLEVLFLCMHWQRSISANTARVSVSTLYKGASVSSLSEMCLYSYLKVVSNLFKRVSFYSPCLFLYSVQSGARNLKPFGGCSTKHAFPYPPSGISFINHTDNILPLLSAWIVI